MLHVCGIEAKYGPRKYTLFFPCFGQQVYLCLYNKNRALIAPSGSLECYFNFRVTADSVEKSDQKWESEYVPEPIVFILPLPGPNRELIGGPSVLGGMAFGPTNTLTLEGEISGTKQCLGERCH